MNTEHTGESFAIFAFSIYSLFIIPYTLYHSCKRRGGQWVQGKNKKKGISRWMEKSLTKGNLIVAGLWLLWALLLWYVNVSSPKEFDPYDILGISRGSSELEIKKAYRQLSLQFHPDKNPDPKANTYFTQYIAKAYEALTDDVSRKNFEDFGHPDGLQSVSVGVALPGWNSTLHWFKKSWQSIWRPAAAGSSDEQ